MRPVFAIILFFFSLAITQNQILSQWRGPYRNGNYPDINLLQAWPKGGPKLLWKISGLGEGYASVAVTQNQICTTGMINGSGLLFTYNLDGELLWKKSYGKEWSGSYPGARCSPVVVDDLIYIETAFGVIYTFKSDNGNVIWSKDLLKEFSAPNLQWGMVESLLIDGNRLYCTPAGFQVSLVCLNRFSGNTIWKSPGNGESAAYCSPLLVNHNGRKLIISMSQRSVFAVNAENGKFLWRFPHRTNWDIHANTPIYKDGYLYFFSGEGAGGAKLQLSQDGSKVTEIWRNKSLDSQIGGVVLVDGFIYGSGYLNGGWQCLDWKTGEVNYDYAKLSRGNIICADGMLYCYGESGELILAKVNPNKFDIHGSLQIKDGSGPHWSHPVIYKGRLYVRHGEVLLVYDISA
jgi:outer membrane protein assembly factor BamB